jgi:hypothetical protein
MYDFDVIMIKILKIVATIIFSLPLSMASLFLCVKIAHETLNIIRDGI